MDSHFAAGSGGEEEEDGDHDLPADAFEYVFADELEDTSSSGGSSLGSPRESGSSDDEGDEDEQLEFEIADEWCVLGCHSRTPVSSSQRYPLLLTAGWRGWTRRTVESRISSLAGHCWSGRRGSAVQGAEPVSLLPPLCPSFVHCAYTSVAAVLPGPHYPDSEPEDLERDLSKRHVELLSTKLFDNVKDLRVKRVEEEEDGEQGILAELIRHLSGRGSSKQMPKTHLTEPQA